jgi:hypothetical protein
VSGAAWAPRVTRIPSACTAAAALFVSMLLPVSAQADPQPDPTPPDAPAPAANEVTLGSQILEPWDVTRNGIPISTNLGNTNKMRVVYSVRIPPHARQRDAAHPGRGARLEMQRRGYAPEPNGLPGGGRGDVNSPCESLPAGNAYDFTPRVAARAIVATSPAAVSSSIQTAWDDRNCTREGHHCPRLVVGSLVAPPSFTPQYVNLVVSAYHQNQNGEMVELESDCMGTDNYGDCHYPSPFEEVPAGSHGKLDVMRLGPQYSGAELLPTSTIQQSPIPQTGNKVVVYSRQVNNLDPGDVLEAHTQVRAQPHNDNPLINIGVIMAEGTLDTTGNFVTAWNGFNCDNVNGCCTSEKRGLARLGAGGTRWVNVVAKAEQNGFDVLSSGFLNVVVRKRFSP